MSKLTDRQHDLLDWVIETHIETAQAVGSKAIKEKYALRYSPATVRNEMGVLEDLGLLVQPHTSSGRVPTDHGYRYYVDHCLGVPDSGSAPAMNRVDQHLQDLSDDVEEPEVFAEEASRLIAALSHEAGLILLEQPVDAGRGRARLYFQGSSQLLEKPEFQNLSKFQALLSALEEKSSLSEWITSQAPDEGVGVRIGYENKLAGLQECALIAAQHPAGFQSVTIALLGPKRLNYAYAIPLVSHVARVVGEILEQKWS